MIWLIKKKEHSIDVDVLQAIKLEYEGESNIPIEVKTKFSMILIMFIKKSHIMIKFLLKNNIKPKNILT